MFNYPDFFYFFFSLFNTTICCYELHLLLSLPIVNLKFLICNSQGIFQRYDKDRSGKIDVMELRDALYGLGYMVPGSVLQLLISKYDNGSGGKVELDFDSFVE